MVTNRDKEYVPKKDKKMTAKLDFSRANKVPWTEKQNMLIKQLTRKTPFTDEEKMSSEERLDPVSNKCAFISGVAGTSKSFTAIYSALKLLSDGYIEKIIYVRSTVGSSPNSVGFLGGSYAEKMLPYAQPLTSSLKQMLPEEQIKFLMDSGKIEVHSTEFIRGVSIANAVVIFDESQNAVHEELVTIISRIAERSKIWFLYDPNQSDLKYNNRDGMVNFSNIFKGDDLENKKQGIMHFEFTKDDIVRSKFCKYVMGKLDDYNEEVARAKYEREKFYSRPKHIEIKSDDQDEWSPSNTNQY